MATARSIMRGTFRLSVAVAVLAAAFGVYQRLAAYSETKDRNYRMVLTLKCGASLSEDILRKAVNAGGLIDLGKVGCAFREPVLASFEDLRQAREGVTRQDLLTVFDTKAMAGWSLMNALWALIAVNLLGLAFVAARAVFGWIRAGFTPSA